MDKAVIYARYSSSHQREESIDGQLRECSAFAERNNLKIVAHYIDRAISGRTEQRPEFQRMIAESAAGQFKFVIVYTLDRFARNRAASAMYKMKLKEHGVRVLSAKENIANDPSGIILESVLEGIAEYYSAELAQKIKRGLTENALAGRWTSGTVPFGFTRDENKHLIPDPKTAPFVAKIFEMYAAGYKKVDIIAFLKAHGVKTRSGADFSRSSFATLLRNEIYIGKFKWDNVEKDDYIAPRVSLEVFMCCQQRLKAVKKSRNIRVRRNDTYLLSGKFFCGHCGAMMQGMCGTSCAGGLYYYYVCSNTRQKKSKCPLGTIQRDALEDAVYNHAAAILSNKENISLIADQAMALNKKEENALLASLKLQRKETQTKLNNCIKAIEGGVISDALTKAMHDHEQSLKDIDAAIAKETLAAVTSSLTKQRIVYFLSSILQGDNTKERVLNTLVHSAKIEKDGDQLRVTVNFNYTATPTLSNEASFIFANVRKNAVLVIHPRLELGTP